MVRTWATMSAKLGADPLPLDLARIIAAEERAVIRDWLLRTELLSFAVLGHRMLGKRSNWSEERRMDLEGQVLRMATQVPIPLWQKNARALRFAILAAENGVSDLLRIYLNISTAPPRDDEAGPLVGRVLAIAYGETGDPSTAAEIQTMLDESSRSAKNADYFQSLWQSGRDRILNALRSESPLEPVLRRVVAFDHHDWIRPLGNALSRAFDGERGSSLRDALISQALLTDLRARASVLDGLSIVQWAHARGELLHLAAVIDQFSDEFATETDGTSEIYPETVFGIAEALLVWHDVNLWALPVPDEPVPTARKRKAKAPKRLVKTRRMKR
jgi:hypothetical protein